MKTTKDNHQALHSDQPAVSGLAAKGAAVLINCEESQTICIEMRALGIEAYSCDLQECSGGHPEWHIQGDAIEEAYSGKYRMMIGHPPCDFMSKAGARWMYPTAGNVDKLRYEKAMKAKEFFFKLMNLFGETNIEPKFRTLGFYEPFGSLMLHDKTETRWVREGKKPPFPTGQYLFYTTKKDCSNMTLFNWCGAEIMLTLSEALGTNKKPTLLGYAIGVGELVDVSILKPTDKNTFVKFVGKEIRKDKNGKEHTYIQWGLHFKNVKKIEPFEWKFGKQGVGLVPYSELTKIKII